MGSGVWTWLEMGNGLQGDSLAYEEIGLRGNVSFYSLELSGGNSWLAQRFILTVTGIRGQGD